MKRGQLKRLKGDKQLGLTGDGMHFPSPVKVASFRHPSRMTILRARGSVLGVTATIENYVLEKGYVTLYSSPIQELKSSPFAHSTARNLSSCFATACLVIWMPVIC